MIHRNCMLFPRTTAAAVCTAPIVAVIGANSTYRKTDFIPHAITELLCYITSSHWNLRMSISNKYIWCNSRMLIYLIIAVTGRPACQGPRTLSGGIFWGLWLCKLWMWRGLDDDFSWNHFEDEAKAPSQSVIWDCDVTPASGKFNN